jgi:hypothetical protein
MLIRVTEVALFVCYDVRMSQKYTIVHFFEELPQGYNFSTKDWPLHTTLLDIFTVGGHLDDVQTGLQKIAATTRTFDSKAISETMFGQN